MAKRNFKVYENLEMKVRSKKRLVVILDTGDRSYFITLNEIPQAIPDKICKLDSAPIIRNAGGKALKIIETIDLMV